MKACLERPTRPCEAREPGGMETRGCVRTIPGLRPHGYFSSAVPKTCKMSKKGGQRTPGEYSLFTRYLVLFVRGRENGASRNRKRQPSYGDDDHHHDDADSFALGHFPKIYPCGYQTNRLNKKAHRWKKINKLMIRVCIAVPARKATVLTY